MDTKRDYFPEDDESFVREAIEKLKQGIWDTYYIPDAPFL